MVYETLVRIVNDATDPNEAAEKAGRLVKNGSFKKLEVVETKEVKRG